VNAIALFIMIGSGLQIFRAFPSFGPKLPEKDFIDLPRAFALEDGSAGPCSGT